MNNMLIRVIAISIVALCCTSHARLTEPIETPRGLDILAIHTKEYPLIAEAHDKYEMTQDIFMRGMNDPIHMENGILFDDKGSSRYGVTVSTTIPHAYGSGNISGYKICINTGFGAQTPIMVLTQDSYQYDTDYVDVSNTGADYGNMVLLIKK